MPVRTWKQNVAHVVPALELQRGDTVEVLVYNDGDDQVQVVAGAPGTVRRMPPLAGARAGIQKSWYG